MAKDMRDIENDRQSGKTTWVVRTGVEKSAVLIPWFALGGLFLWGMAYYSVNVLFIIPALAVIVMGSLWQARLSMMCRYLRKDYSQPLAAALHRDWLVVYVTMQSLTILIFMI
ncbi:MAG: hypothetical protein HY279_00295 [Nitrospinae bacterium]|nr:hypothetical protein [Nitrospinota bacterium]